MIRRAFAGFLSLLLVVGGLLAAPAPSASAAGEQDYLGAARLLNRYGLVQGDQRGYRFGDPITRAEVAKLLVYSLGYGSQAEQYRGRRDFPDTPGHWAEGVAALAKNLGVMRGYPEGDFRPENPVSYAEIIAALSRLVGLEPGAEAWPLTYFRPAREAGIIPSDMGLDGRLEEAATRGDVFVLLKRTLADVKNLKGQTLLQLYLDKVPPVLTVDPLPQETQYATLTVSGMAPDAAVVKINGLPALISDGYFRQDVPLIVGPNTIRVQALDDAGNLKEATVLVKRQPGAPDSITLWGPSSVKVRQTAVFHVSLLDANGAEGADRSKLQVDVTPDMGKFDPQTGTFTAGTKAGTAVITVRAGSAEGSISVTVDPGPLNRMAVAPAEAGLGAGESQTFSATGYDAYGNQFPLSDVKWSADGGTIGANGRFQAPVLGGTGVYTVTASAGGRTAAAKVYPLNYEVASVKVTAPVTTFRANGTSEVTLTATVLDSKGQPVTDYKGDLTVTTSDPRMAVPVQSAVPVVGGAAQVPIRAGSYPGTVRITVSTNLNRMGSATLTASPQMLQSVRLAGRAMPSTDGNPLGTVEAIALDQDGYPIRSPLNQTVVVGLTIKPEGLAKFLSNGQETADIALGDVDPDTGDVRSQIMVQYTAGAGTLLIDGKAKPQSMEWVRILVGAIAGDQAGVAARLGIEPIADVEAGQVRSIYVNVLDASGYRVTQPGPLTGVIVTLQDQNGQIWTPAGNQAEPGRFRFDVTQPQAGTYTYTAVLQPRGATATAGGTVKAGVLDHITVTATPAVIPADNRTQTVLRVELADANGNRLTAPPYLVKFAPDGNGVTQPLTNQTVTSVNGVAELRVTAGQVVGQERFQVTVASPTAPLIRVLPDPVSVTVTTRGAPQRLQLSYGDNNRNGTVGDSGDATGRAALPFTVAVDVLDQGGNLVSYEGGRSVTLTVLNLATGTVAARLTGSAVQGRAAFPITLRDAGSYAIKAESAGLLSALTKGYGGSVENAVIQPGYHTGVRITSDLPILKAGDAANSYAWVKAELTDASGNVTTNQTGMPITVDLKLLNGNYTYGYFTIDDQWSTPYMVGRRTVTIPAGASASEAVKLFPGSAGTVSLQAETRDGLRSATASVSVQTLGEIARLVVTQPPAATPVAGSRLVVITAQDSGNRRLSGMGGTITVAGLSSGAKIIGFYDASGVLVPVDGETEWDVPLDRGQIQVLVSAPSGTLSAFEAYDTSDRAPNSTFRPLFYVQF